MGKHYQKHEMLKRSTDTRENLEDDSIRNGSQLLQIQKQMQKFVNWSPDTVWQTILQILESEDLENGEICVKLVPHNLKDEQQHNVTTL